MMLDRAIERSGGDSAFYSVIVQPTVDKLNNAALRKGGEMMNERLRYQPYDCSQPASPFEDGVSFYRRSREMAGVSAAKAAELLDVSGRTLFAWEVLETPAPDGKVVEMARVYQDPLLMIQHCKAVCPIGQVCAFHVEETSFESWTVHFLKEFQDVKARTGRLLEILYDGRIQPEEIPDMVGILEELCDLERELTEIRFLTMNLMYKKEKPSFAETASFR